jgi:hypothetical protein
MTAAPTTYPPGTTFPNGIFSHGSYTAAAGDLWGVRSVVACFQRNSFVTARLCIPSNGLIQTRMQCAMGCRDTNAFIPGDASERPVDQAMIFRRSVASQMNWARVL